MKEGLLASEDCKFSGPKTACLGSKHLTAAKLTELREHAEKTFMLRKPFFYLNPKNFFTHLYPKLKTRDGIVYFAVILMELFKTSTSNNKLSKILAPKS